MKLLDLYSGAGGASAGYKQAGFDEIVGVDNTYHSNYPFTFVQSDAIDFLIKIRYGDYDLIHASPPCQSHTWAAKQHDKYPYDNMVEITRHVLNEIGTYYVIENVLSAPLLNPIMLDGPMFKLNVIRKRLFETNWPLQAPKRGFKIGTANKHKYVTPVGHGCNGTYNYMSWATAMQIDWMTMEQMAQAVPPAYTKYIGKEFLEFYSLET